MNKLFSLSAICLFSVLFATEISQNVVNYTDLGFCVFGILFNIFIIMNTR